jgi:hypothetical protein
LDPGVKRLYPPLGAALVIEVRSDLRLPSNGVPGWYLDGEHPA